MRKLLRALSFGALVGIMAACAGPEPRGPCIENGSIGTICGFANPEDLELVEPANVILASNMRFDGRGGESMRGGYIAALVPGKRRVRRIWPTGEPADSAPDRSLGDAICMMPPRGAAFYPHGMTSTKREGRSLVYVITHEGQAGGREAVEVFALTGRGEAASMSWKACIPLPPGTTGNDLAVAPDGEVIVSNYQPSGSLWHTIKANVFGMTTGDVRGWMHGRGWRSLPRTSARQANGIAISRDGTFVFYSETGTGRVYRTPRQGAGPSTSVHVGGKPDNLAWTRRGTLLVATHTQGVGLLRCALGRAPCRTSWAIYEIDPKTMASKRIRSHDGSIIGAVSTPLETGGRLYLGSIYDDRIGVIQEDGR